MELHELVPTSSRDGKSTSVVDSHPGNSTMVSMNSTKVTSILTCQEDPPSPECNSTMLRESSTSVPVRQLHLREKNSAVNRKTYETEATVRIIPQDNTLSQFRHFVNMLPNDGVPPFSSREVIRNRLPEAKLQRVLRQRKSRKGRFGALSKKELRESHHKFGVPPPYLESKGRQNSKKWSAMQERQSEYHLQAQI